MRGFDHAMILSPSFHGLRKERLAQWLAFCVLNTTKNALQIMSLAAYASETKNTLWVIVIELTQSFPFPSNVEFV